MKKNRSTTDNNSSNHNNNNNNSAAPGSSSTAVSNAVANSSRAIQISLPSYLEGSTMPNMRSGNNSAETICASMSRNDVRTLALSMSSAVYRGPLTHNSTVELQEGFNILNHNEKQSSVTMKNLETVMHSVSMHTNEDELRELLKVAQQDDQTSELSFADFLLLMTKEVDEKMVSEMSSAFELYDTKRTGFVTAKQFKEIFQSMGERSSDEEIEELMMLVECTDDNDMIDYRKFVVEMANMLNTM